MTDSQTPASESLTMLPPAAAQPSDIPGLVAELDALLAGTNVTGILTDFKFNAAGKRRRLLALETEVRPTRYVPVSSWPTTRAFAIRKLTGYTGLPEDVCNVILDRARSLASANEIGAWRIGPRAENPERVMDGNGMGHIHYGQFPAFAWSHDMLCRALEHSVSYIDIDVRQAEHKGTKAQRRRRCWITFYDHAGHPIGCHTTQVTSRAVRELLTEGHHMQDRGQDAIAMWARQLKTDPDHFVAAYLEIVKLEQLLGVTRIVLGPAR